MLKKYYWIIFLIIAVTAIGLGFWQKLHWPTAWIELGGKRIEVLVADTIGHQHVGLGKRDDLGIYGGMLFIHSEEKKYGILMRDMRFPIDIVWLNNGEVIDIAPNVQTEPGVSEAQLRVYYPRKLVTAVLELPAGWTEQNGVKIGDFVKILDI